MRIGEFSKKHNLTIDTIRHYMDLELIIPEKNGAHYFFNEKCSDDLREIIFLKETGFSLQEIQKIFSLKRLAGLKINQDKEYYKQIFMDKREYLLESKNKIEGMVLEIEKRIQELGETVQINKEINIIGVPIESLHLLACPVCGKRLGLNHGEIKDDMVIQGELNCKCGEKISIDNGIIIVDRNIIKEPEVDVEWSRWDYIEKTPHEFVNFMYTAIEWIMNKIMSINTENKMILELGIGSGLFLSHFESSIEEDTLYIGVDYNLDFIRSIKKHAEINSKHRKYMFICCEVKDIPIKNDGIDVIVDYLGSTNYNFKFSGHLVDIVNNKLKSGGYWAGSFFHFKEYCKTLQRIGEGCSQYFKLNNIIKGFEKNDYTLLDRKNIGFVDKSGVLESFLIEGDRVYQEVIFAKKR